MRSLNESIKAGWPLLLSGIVLVLVLQGCTTPLVDVQVTTCAQGNATDDEDGKGACYAQAVPPQIAPGKCKNSSGQFVACPGGAMCTSGTRCQNNPGSCNRKTCRTILQLPAGGGTSGNCYCDCNY